MRRLREALESVLAETKFDLGRIVRDRSGISTTYSRNPNEIVERDELRNLASRGNWNDEDAARARSAKAIVPEDDFRGFVAVLEDLLGQYIDEETGQFGHAFPMESARHGSITAKENGIYCEEYISSAPEFAETLVRGAAIIGAEKLAGLLSGWLKGEPVRYRTCAILNGLYLRTSIEPLPGITLEPLPLTTAAAFGSIPVHFGDSVENYRGRTRVNVESTAAPAFVRPKGGRTGLQVSAGFVAAVSMQGISQALALELNRHIEVASEWNDYGEISLYLAPGSRSSRYTSRGGLDAQGVGFSHSVDFRTGAWSITIEENLLSEVTAERIGHLIGSMNEHKRIGIDIVISRWCKSHESFRSLEDRFIDLRIALEALYLKDIRDKYRGEMRYRLALCGAWHLGASSKERKEIRDTLRKAYDVASKAVHHGKLEFCEANRNLLVEGQALCRSGILKILDEGVPSDWGDLILGD